MLLRQGRRARPSGPSPVSAQLPLAQALALGLLHGPTELLPVSSSAHTTLIPLMGGWRYAELDPELRKAFEVALHTGAGLALALELRGDLLKETLQLDGRHALVIALTLAPPALAGLALHGAIERRLGGPRSIAAGLIAGSLAMGVAELRHAPGTRARSDARALDGMVLGIAQAAALMPGVSRSGATLAAARVRGFAPADSQELSWHAALPVILGASALTGVRLARRPPSKEARTALIAGALASFLSTRASTVPLRKGESRRSLLGFCVYRCLLALVVMRRLRSAHNRNG